MLHFILLFVLKKIFFGFDFDFKTWFRGDARAFSFHFAFDLELNSEFEQCDFEHRITLLLELLGQPQALSNFLST